jgi:hypothetical protein
MAADSPAIPSARERSMSSLAAQLEHLWKSATAPPDLKAWFVGLPLAPDQSQDTRQELLTALKLDQQYRWKQPQPWPAEDYFQLLPAFLQTPDCLVELAAGEFDAQVVAGRQVCIEDFCRRFPGHGEQLRARVKHLEPLLESTNIAGTLLVKIAQEPLNGRYRLDRIIGEGKFGRVFLAHDIELQRDVAIKMPVDERLQDSANAEEYLREARTLAGLDHPHIVPVFDVGRFSNGSIYVVSRYIEGGTLGGLIRRERPSPAEAARILIPIAGALAFAHTQHIIHRDVKPDNILFDERTQRPFLTDFGLAITQEDHRLHPQIAGTPAYMSPEQVRGESNRLDGRSDLFSLGVIFYEMLTGQRPFRAKTRDQLFQEIVAASPAPPRSLNSSIPPALESICLKALARRPADRHPTATAFAQELEEALQFRRTPANAPAASASSANAAAPGFTPAANAPHTAQNTAATAAIPGMCPVCGVVHDRLQRQPVPDDVRFCTSPGCRTPLVDPCANCGREIWIWDEHCCRCNQCSTKLAAAELQLSTLQAPLRAALTSRRFTDVLTRLEEIKKRPELQHRRLFHARSWCRELEAQIEAELLSLAEQAEERFRQSDFAAAADLLAQIPENRRSMTKWREAVEKAEAVTLTEAEFRLALEANLLQQATDCLTRLKTLQPARTDLAELLRLRITELHQQARKAAQQHNYLTAVSLLTPVPDTLRDNDALRLWTSRRDEILLLEKQLHTAFAEHSIKLLHEALARLEELCPDYPAANDARAELHRLVEMRHRQAQGLAELNRDYVAALARLADIPEPLIRPAVRSRLLERHDKVQQLEEELLQHLAREDLGAAWNCSSQLETLVNTPSPAQLQLRSTAEKQNADAATLARHQKNWTLALQLLELLPAPLRDQQLHREITTATERISELNRKLTRALEKKQLRRADAVAAELHALQPQIAPPEDDLRKLAEKYLRHATRFIEQQQDYTAAEQLLQDVPERFRSEHWKSLINRRQHLETLVQSLRQLLDQKRLNELHHGLQQLKKFQPQHPQLPTLTAGLRQLVSRIESDCEDRIRRFLDYEMAATELEQIPAPLRNPDLYAKVRSLATEIHECREQIRSFSHNRNWSALQQCCRRLLKILPHDYVASLQLKLATEELRLRQPPAGS